MSWVCREGCFENAGQWGAPGDAPVTGAGSFLNFLEEKYQEGLERVPIFVYHGNADRNAPFELTAELVEQLKSRGVKIEFLVEEGIGHNPPGKETIKAYHRWLEKVIGHKLHR